jgi:methionine-rich copper-binding protein CopC
MGVVAALVLANGPDIEAHATYRDASPAAETRVVGAPRYVLVTFTEEIKSISLVVKGPGGVVVTNGEAIISPGDRTNVSVQIHDGGDGRYEVSWDLVSAFDLDTSSGGFGFWVGLPAASAAAAPAPTVSGAVPSVSGSGPAATSSPPAPSQPGPSASQSTAPPISQAPSPAADPRVARDGRRLADEPVSTQAVFLGLWGDQAAVEWAAEHNAQLGSAR